MKNLVFFIMSISFAFGQAIDPNDVLGALSNSGWESDYTQTDNVDFTVTDTQISSSPTSSSTLDTPCEKEDQNTIPYGFFLSLLAGHRLNVEQSPETGIMNINGGTMIGNCNAMLETKVGKPNGDIPYTFQVAIKESETCSDGKCEYEVYHVDKSINQKVKKSYTPDFQGFLSCLKDAEVFVDGKIKKEKIAATDFMHSEKGVNKSSKLLFLSHGFKKSKLTGVYSENKLPGKGCYFFEDIKKDGFTTYSRDDLNKSKLDKLFTKICSSGDYKIVSKHIDDFKEVEALQKLIIKVRDQLLAKEVKELHDELAVTEDLSEIDTEKYASTIEDFDELLIQPLKDKLKIAQKLHSSPGSSEKEALLRQLFSSESQIDKMMNLNVKSFKKEIAKYMDEKSGDLIKYAQSPYLTSNDYLLMVNPKKGSPIDDSRWTSGALKLFKIQNTAFKYGRYNDDFWEKNYKSKDKYQGEKRFESSVVLDSQIAASVYKKSESIELLSKTAKNPDVNYAKNYQSLKTANMQEIEKQMMLIQQNMKEYQYKVMTNCAVEKQRKYFINQQACVREAQEALENCTAELNALYEQRSAVERKYNALSQKHVDARIQAGLEGSTGGTVISSDASYNFSFKPQAPTTSNTDWRNQPNPGGVIIDPNRGSIIQSQGYQQAGYMPSYQSQGFYQNSPFNSGINNNMYRPQAGFNFGFNSGMNRGPSSYYGNQSYMNYGSPQNYGGPQAYSQQGPMNYYQGQYTQPGGPMSFSFN